MQGNIPSIGLATTVTLAAVEKKIPSVTILYQKKTDFNAKTLDTEKNILLGLIITHLRVIYLMQRRKKGIGLQICSSWFHKQR